ncbi:MAG: helix-turn-helix transcriptional regulator [Myxococcota bacterium]
MAPLVVQAPCSAELSSAPISVVQIRQSTTGVFSDLFFRLSCLVFVHQGSKRVSLPDDVHLEGASGDVFLFSGHGLATVMNRAWSGEDYLATLVAYPVADLRTVFPDLGSTPPVQVATKARSRVFASLDGVTAAMQADLPEDVRRHRLLEPLHWLKAEGYVLAPAPPGPAERIRALFESDLSHPWRSEDAARHLSVSPATLRRMLSRSGQSFSKLLTTTRLEHGLAQLQTSDRSVSEIAMSCGFANPSHFSDAFKSRFGLSPRQIRSAA